MATRKNFPFPVPEKSDSTKEEKSVLENKNNITYERPTIITIICGYFFISWSLSLITSIRLLFQTKSTSFNFSSFGSLSGFISFLISVLLFVSIFGFWSIKKWGVYLYTATNIFIFIYLLYRLGSYGISFGDAISSIIWGSILPIFIIIVGFKNLNRMQ